jgi:hypothetical protein
VHQGDHEGAKGVYHINAVDAVTQWQVVGCAEKISEWYLLPVLEAVLAQLPFAIRGFHADNGSEYIHHRVAEMLRKLHAEFTQSRACRSQDHALVEGKNGAVIRQLVGYGHIAGQHAEALQKFYTEHLNPYLNFHRPCGFATVSLDERGKRQHKYKIEDYRTRFEKLQSLPAAERFLPAGAELAGTGTAGAGGQRHRLRPPDECGQNEIARAMLAAIAAEVCLKQQGGRLEKWKTNPRFSTFPPGPRDDDDEFFLFKPKPTKGSRPLRGLLVLLRRSPSGRAEPGFMLILRLENAIVTGSR